MYKYVEEDYEYDSRISTWNNYIKIYKTSRIYEWFEFDIKELVRNYKSEGKGRHFSYLKNSEEFKSENSEFSISGDLIFNFNDKEKRNYYKDFFDQIIKINDKDVEKDYMKKLEICKDCYKLENTALMITTGGLNNYKGRKGNDDRFDVFAYKMKLFMEKGIEIGQNKQKDILIKFLKSKYFIKNVEKNERIYLYFKDWYLIDDKKYVRRLIESGERRCKSSVPDEEDAKSYIDLALEYWEFRKNKYGG